MRGFFLSLLSVSLLVHAALGCCWHDEHSAGACDRSLVSFVSGSLCEHNHDAAADGHDSHHPCKGHSHCHGLCNYLPAQKTQIGKCQTHVLIDFAIDTKAACGSHVAALSITPGTQDFCPPPPIRLHLFYQILLI